MTYLDSLITNYNRINWDSIMHSFFIGCGLSWLAFRGCKYHITVREADLHLVSEEDMKLIEFTDWDNLYTEISTAIIIRKRDAESYKSYIKKILTQLQIASSYFYVTRGDNKRFIPQLTKFIFNTYPYPNELPQFMECIIREQITNSFEVYYQPNTDTEFLYCKEVENFQKNLKTIRQTTPYYMLFKIYTDLKQLATNIQSFILENNIFPDLLYIQNEIGIYLTDQVSVEDLVHCRRWSIQKAYSLINHSTSSSDNSLTSINVEVQMDHDTRPSLEYLPIDSEIKNDDKRSVFESFEEQFINDGKFEGFLEANLNYMGVDPYSPSHIIKPNDTVYYNRMIGEWKDDYSLPIYFNRSMQLTEEISGTIKAIKNDECELQKYVCSIVESFNNIMLYFLPDKEHSNFYLSKEVIRILRTGPGSDFETFAKDIKEIVYLVAHRHNEEYVDDTLFATEVRAEYYKKQCNNTELISCKEKDYINHIMNIITEISGIIEGALLENGIQHSIFYYQDFCGIKLCENVTIDTVADAMDWTSTKVVSYAKKYKHKIDYQEVTDIYRDKDSRSTVIGFDNTFKIINSYEGLKQAYENSLIERDGRLVISRQQFVMFCFDNDFFCDWKTDAWKCIDGVLKDNRKGTSISSKQLAQSFQDIQTGGVNSRLYRKKMKKR